MKLTSCVMTAALAGAVLLGASASKAGVFDFSYVDSATDGTLISAAGVITTSATEVGGYYTITDITGERNGFVITALLPVGGYAANDNLFSPTPTYFTFGGVSFSAADGYLYNLANNGVNVYTDDSSQTNPVGYPQTPVNVTITAVPEISTWAMMIVGFAGLGLAAYRRTKKSATAFAAA
jgi:hypothetical protein